MRILETSFLLTSRYLEELDDLCTEWSRHAIWKVPDLTLVMIIYFIFLYLESIMLNQASWLHGGSRTLDKAIQKENCSPRKRNKVPEKFPEDNHHAYKRIKKSRLYLSLQNLFVSNLSNSIYSYKKVLYPYLKTYGKKQHNYFYWILKPQHKRFKRCGPKLQT